MMNGDEADPPGWCQGLGPAVDKVMHCQDAGRKTTGSSPMLVDHPQPSDRKRKVVVEEGRMGTKLGEEGRNGGAWFWCICTSKRGEDWIGLLIITRL